MLGNWKELGLNSSNAVDCDCDAVRFGPHDPTASDTLKPVFRIKFDQSGFFFSNYSNEETSSFIKTCAERHKRLMIVFVDNVSFSWTLIGFQSVMAPFHPISISIGSSPVSQGVGFTRCFLDQGRGLMNLINCT